MTETSYPPLPEPDATTVGLGAVWNRHSMRAYVDAALEAQAREIEALRAAAGRCGCLDACEVVKRIDGGTFEAGGRE